MKNFYILIETYGKGYDFEEYVEAETKDEAVKKLCQQHANLNPELVAELIQEIEEGSPEYDEMKEDKLYSEKTDRDQRDVYESSRGV